MRPVPAGSAPAAPRRLRRQRARSEAAAVRCCGSRNRRDDRAPSSRLLPVAMVSVNRASGSLYTSAIASRNFSSKSERITSQGGVEMASMNRRRVLQLSGAAVAASTGGIAAILASGRAPAYAQATPLHWLRWSDFVPASDQMLRAQMVPESEKALGIKLNLESINANDIQARITSAVQSRTGADIILVVNNWPQLYADSVVDVSDVAEAIGSAHGGYYEISKNVAHDGKKWIGVPWSIGGGLLTNRKSWWEELGYSETKFPETWDEYRAAGKKLKAQGRPMGQSLGHTFGDPVVFWYPYLWSWGGKELEPDGKSVALNSKETIESVKYAVGFWKDA